MRAVVVSEPGKVEVRDVPDPVISDYEALVRIEVCGICGSTDRRMIDRQLHLMPLPMVLGHEAVGIVEKVGSKVVSYKVGDRVARPVAVWGGEGKDLHAGFGGMAQYGFVRDARALANDGDDRWLRDYTAQRQVVVPPDISALDASLAISLSECGSFMLAGGYMGYQRVAVLGTGVVGLSFTYYARLLGALQVITLGRRESRLALARELGADATLDTRGGDLAHRLLELTGGEKLDVLIDGIGEPQLIMDCWPALSEQGRCGLYGAPSVGSPAIELTPGVGPSKEALQSWPVEEQRSYFWVWNLLRRGLVPVNKLRTHTWPMEEAVEAFREVRAGEVVKGFLIM